MTALSHSHNKADAEASLSPQPGYTSAPMSPKPRSCAYHVAFAPFIKGLAFCFHLVVLLLDIAIAAAKTHRTKSFTAVLRPYHSSTQQCWQTGHHGVPVHLKLHKLCSATQLRMGSQLWQDQVHDMRTISHVCGPVQCSTQNLQGQLRDFRPLLLRGSAHELEYQIQLGCFVVAC